ncbi:MAG: alpha/beta hydrolase [Alphaproteobacteria bacterium]|nr:alpha/beta hydrolase [Alphaproteobacteria bacterium]
MSSVGHIEVGRDRFPIAIQGEGRPILFVHGAPGDWRTFAPHAALLADKYRCITYTQRWFGAEEWREDGPPFGTTLHAHDLIALAESLGGERPVLVAWSYGAHVALAAALMRPDLFSALFAYEPGFGTFVTEPVLLSQYLKDVRAAWAPAFAARDRNDSFGVAKAMSEASLGEGSYSSLNDEQRAIVEDSAPALMRMLDQQPPAAITCQELSQMQIPAMIAMGARTRPCYEIPSRAAAACINCDMFEIEDEGHSWPVDNPAGFTRVVDQWLTSLAEAGWI